jgi:hypothetical protein
MHFKKPFIVNGYEINELFHEDYQIKKETRGVLDSDDDYKNDLPEAQELDSEEEG